MSNIADIKHPYSILDNRILWVDGDSSYTIKGILDILLSGDTTWKDKYVIDPDDFSVKKINQLENDVNLKSKSDINIPDNLFDWNIPENYINLDVRDLVTQLLKRELENSSLSESEKVVRCNRVKLEFELWERLKMFSLLNVLVYMIDTFNKHNVVWGTGRGSSCCSYILYLIGVHDVDSVKYGLETNDFFRV